jgi:Rps23 Pro-64 3,4-dihydroxylase Tpa1-like proline 4-hydroxylase
MNLRYQIPNQLYYIQNFLDQKTYKQIHDAAIKERKEMNIHSVKNIWEKGLINNVVSPEKIDIYGYPPFEKLKVLTKHNQIYQLKAKKITTAIYYMKKGAGINWHSDYSWEYGATYYLNNRWNNQFGGEFMFTNEGGHGWIPPVGNSLVILKSPFKHKVNPVLSPIMPRISVQMFIK